MSEDSRSHKRTRNEEPQALEPLVHDAEFWLDDGNVVLVARDTVFRVYRGLLAAQSTVFADMFTSSSSAADEVYEGCPIVRVSDSPEELRHFLRVLFPKSRRLFYNDDKEAKVTFDQVCAVIRLAHKYHVEDIERQALSALKAYYTDDFDQFENMDDDDDDTLPIAFADVSVPHAVAAINIARLTDTPSILPLAFYHCCVLGGKVLDGYAREDGTIDHLEREDVKKCMDGRNALGREALRIILRIFRDETCDQCPTPTKCILALPGMLVDAVNLESSADCNVLNSWTGFMNDIAQLWGLCEVCRHALAARDVKERRVTWRRLPEIFQLEVEGWDDEEHA
ncbi:hypothetical protein OH76DRAFT_1351645 [Lentinus brumalis]|uniref:BTB domain-containing protein n=1 Tax=Lentinus brumalis TaxID=2498619 RepID=A0A371D8R5_9APHY|nr:hypothetical protein OH76DRAFT_1351645 [Polyporus brumalis]